MMHSSEDDAFCRLLAGTGELVSNVVFFGVKRKGRLLLCLPHDASAALNTLKLYQPQTKIARWFVCCIRGLIWLRIHRLLPKIHMEIRDEGPLAKLKHQEGKIGILLGNPKGSCRCALVLRYDENQLVVDKVAVDKLASASVKSEAIRIKSLPKSLRGLPHLCGNREGGNWALYTTRYVDGRSIRAEQDHEVIDLLMEWQKNAEGKPMGECKLWQSTAGLLRDAGKQNLLGRLSGIDDLPIKQGILHGDFAPWNIKRSTNGGIVVLDWEHGSLDGPAGWDWLHFVMQRGGLVEDLSAKDILDKCRLWASQPEGQRLLQDAGWGTEIEWWIGSYLLYSQWMMGFDREGLITEWAQ